MFDSMLSEPQRKTWYLLPIQVLCNLLLTGVLLSTANIVFLLPFPYRERLPMFLGIATIGFVVSAASAMLSLPQKETPGNSQYSENSHGADLECHHFSVRGGVGPLDQVFS
jgi:hypothetical protein